MEQVFVDKMTEGTRELGIVLSEQQMEQTTKLSLVVLTDNGARHRQVQQHVR